MPRVRNRAGFIAIGALVVISLGATSAGAARLIDSWDVKDDSLRSIDIRNGTLTALDVASESLTGAQIKDGSLTAADFSEVPDSGGSGSAKVYTWTASHTANGSTGGPANPVATSTMKIPAMAHLTGLDIDVTGDFSGCDEGNVGVQPAEAGTFRNFYGPFAMGYFNVPGTKPDQIVLSDTQSWPEPAPLDLIAQCYDWDGVPGGRAPVPSFDVTVTFTIEEVDASAPDAFN